MIESFRESLGALLKGGMAELSVNSQDRYNAAELAPAVSIGVEVQKAEGEPLSSQYLCDDGE